MDRNQLLLWSRKYCNNPLLEDEDDFAMVLTELSEIVERVGVTSESLSDMSQSFGTGAALSIRSLLSPYKRLKAL